MIKTAQKIIIIILLMSSTVINTDNQKRFNFHLKNKPLIDLINELAQARKINIMVPQGTAAIPATTTVTFSLPKLLSLKEAWRQLIMILDLAGYTIEEQQNIIFIKKIDGSTLRDPLHLYINESIANLPPTEEFIRAIFYLKNLTVKNHYTDVIEPILKDTLSPNSYYKDEKTNAIIITDKANNIKAAMTIIGEFDKGGIREGVEVLPLYNTSGAQVEAILTNLLPQSQTATPGAGGGTTGTTGSSTYFPKNTRVVNLDRTNSLIIMGTRHAIEMVKDFIIKYIDRPLESGESLLHVYEAQYLDATTLASTLNSIIKQETTVVAGQAAGQAITTGPKQYFKNVIITAETPKASEQVSGTTAAFGSGGSYGYGPSGAQASQPATTTSQAKLVGGNRLIVAATKQDWVRIKQLIEQLDQPQPQVALEVLVVDVTVNHQRILGSQMRDPEGFTKSISKNVNWQTANLGTPVIKSNVAFGDDGQPTTAPAGTVNALMANLLQLTDDANLATAAHPGSLVFSIKDTQATGVWSFWELLNAYANTTILAQPFIVTKNHKQATVSITQARLLQGGANTSTVSVNVLFEWVLASLTVNLLPHISTAGDNISLELVVTVQEYLSADANNRITRVVQTNANVGNGEILALGGLTRMREDLSLNQTPPFSKIPILGWFFKREEKTKSKNNLLILISPTILQPHPAGGIDPFTGRRLKMAQYEIDQSLNFENLHDPITRWFFKPDVCFGNRTINNFAHKTQEVEETASPKEAIIPCPPPDNQDDLPVIEATPLTTPSQEAPAETLVAHKAPDNQQEKNNQAQQLKMLVQNIENPLKSRAMKVQADPL